MARNGGKNACVPRARRIGAWSTILNTRSGYSACVAKRASIAPCASEALTRPVDMINPETGSATLGLLVVIQHRIMHHAVAPSLFAGVQGLIRTLKEFFGIGNFMHAR